MPRLFAALFAGTLGAMFLALFNQDKRDFEKALNKEATEKEKKRDMEVFLEKAFEIFVGQRASLSGPGISMVLGLFDSHELSLLVENRIAREAEDLSFYLGKSDPENCNIEITWGKFIFKLVRIDPVAQKANFIVKKSILH